MENDIINKILSECISAEVPINCIEYQGIFVPDSYRLIANSIENFEVYEDDTWVCTFPKAGINLRTNSFFFSIIL